MSEPVRAPVIFAQLPTVYPTKALVLTVLVSGGILVLTWVAFSIGLELNREVFRAGLMGLAAATLAHLLGALAGAFLAPLQGSLIAFFASTVVRFLLTPILALSLYFALPMQPKVLLIGVAAGYLVILVADLATMVKVSSRTTATRRAG